MDSVYAYKSKELQATCTPFTTVLKRIAKIIMAKKEWLKSILNCISNHSCVELLHATLASLENQRLNLAKGI